MQLEVGKFYRTRDGRKVEILRIIKNPIYPVAGIIYGRDMAIWDSLVSWTLEGIYNFKEEDGKDIVSEWREPIVFRGWVNIYPDGARSIYETKERADYCANSDRIACVYVTGTEGEEQ